MFRRTTLALNAANPAAVPFLMSNTLLALVVASSALVSSPASSQSSPAPAATQPAPSKTPYDSVVVADSCTIRAAASVETGYVFGALTKGSAVRVLQEEAGWVRIQTSGNAFDGWVGFVKAGPGIELAADGKSITIKSRAAEICAINSERDFDPDASYRGIGRILVGESASVVEKLQGASGATYYAVQLGANCSGWIPADAISRPEPAPTTTTPTASPTASPTTTTVPVSTATTTIEVDTETGQVVKADVATGETVVVQEGDGAAASQTPTDAAAGDATAAATAESADGRAKLAEQVKRIRVSDLHGSYKSLRAQPTETAEFEALRERCIAIAEDPTSTRSEIEGAKFLAKKVDLDIAIQKDLREIAERKRKLDADFKGVADLEIATLARMPYDNVGRLNASKFYTGERMPLLYVLQDPGTGYTIAYIVPTESYDLSAMLGLLVGVKGPMKYDESLRLNVIQPSAVVPIMPKSASPASATATGSETQVPAASDK